MWQPARPVPVSGQRPCPTGWRVWSLPLGEHPFLRFSRKGWWPVSVVICLLTSRSGVLTFPNIEGQWSPEDEWPLSLAQPGVQPRFSHPSPQAQPPGGAARGRICLSYSQGSLGL